MGRTAQETSVMKKSEVISAILQESIVEFAEHGFGGSSLRNIALKANTALSAINAYFGTKRSLYVAAEHAVWGEISLERNSLLRKVTALTPGKPTSVFDLVSCLAQPIVKRALSRDIVATSQIRFIKDRLNEHASDGALIVVANNFVKPWIDELERSCQTLARAHCVWAFSYCVGVIYSYQLIDHRYDALLDISVDRTVEDITVEIAAFCSGGIQSLIDLHSTSGQGSMATARIHAGLKVGAI
jgi:AcrR family transcriptional regulator